MGFAPIHTVINPKATMEQQLICTVEVPQEIVDFGVLARSVILVIMSRGSMDVSFAKTNDKIKSILWVGYSGEAGGTAIADVIFEFHNPSGRLTTTWYPQSDVDVSHQVFFHTHRPEIEPITVYLSRSYCFYEGEIAFSIEDGISYSIFEHKLVEAPQLVSVPLAADQVCHSNYTMLQKALEGKYVLKTLPMSEVDGGLCFSVAMYWAWFPSYYIM